MFTKIILKTHISPRLFDQNVYKSETSLSRHPQNFSLFYVNVTSIRTEEIYLLSHDSTIIHTSDIPPKNYLKHAHLPPTFIKTSINQTTTISPIKSTNIILNIINYLSNSLRYAPLLLLQTTTSPKHALLSTLPLTRSSVQYLQHHRSWTQGTRRGCEDVKGNCTSIRLVILFHSYTIIYYSLSTLMITPPITNHIAMLLYPLHLA
jgi:hypothetical protein